MTRATIPTADGPMSLEVAEPAGLRPAPGVLVVHDALGMTADLVAQTRWLAENGYLAVAPDLYHRGGRIRCMVATMRALAAGTGPVFEDLSATRDWITSREDCTGAVGVVGFCMGGNIALMLAASGTTTCRVSTTATSRPTATRCSRVPVRSWRATAGATGPFAALRNVWNAPWSTSGSITTSRPTPMLATAS
ncbi:MAG: dienelactone hydrolase family protein [Microthrixaceae bacterium]